MRRRLSALAAVALVLASAAPALAQTPDDDHEYDRDCMDEYGRDLCDPAVWGMIVGYFGLESAEAAQAKGQRGVRVFTIDGYSQDMPMVSILAPRLQEHGYLDQPALEVRALVRPDVPNAGSTRIGRAAWSWIEGDAKRLENLVAASPARQSDASLPLPRKPDAVALNGDIVVVSSCKHAWVTVTESLTKDGVIRRVRHACGDDMLYEVSLAFSGYALRGFPHCNHIDPATQRNDSTHLQSCLALQGDDGIAAAEVLNVIQGDDVRDIVDLANYLTPDAQLVWPGHAATKGPAEIAKAFADEFFSRSYFEAYRLEGAPERVAVSGVLERYTDDGLEMAAVEQTWRREAGNWRLARMTVAPFAPKR
jgi:ketosteroid isomerase-like protein